MNTIHTLEKISQSFNSTRFSLMKEDCEVLFEQDLNRSVTHSEVSSKLFRHNWYIVRLGDRFGFYRCTPKPPKARSKQDPLATTPFRHITLLELSNVH